MAEVNSTSRGVSRSLRRILVRVLVYLTLYVLSIGPMFWKWYGAMHLEQNDLIVAFYLPLLFACRIEFISDVVNWYIGLWIL
jgi:hypothetical protein